MKYRLKDQTMQANLDALSGGDFSLKLQEQVTPYKLTFTFVEVGFSREKGKNTRWFTATFRSEEIEEIPEYNPRAWNDYPKVTPPEGDFMRVIFLWNDGSIGYRCGIFREGVWVDSEDTNLEIENVYRFRPWDDPDEEENKE